MHTQKIGNSHVSKSKKEDGWGREHLHLRGLSLYFCTLKLSQFNQIVINMKIKLNSANSFTF